MMSESFGVFCLKMFVTIILWSGIELVDGAMDSWELTGYLSLLLAAAIVFGGIWIILFVLESDD